MDFIHVTLRFSDKKFSKNRIMLSSQSLHENGWCTLLSEACIGNPMGLPMGGVRAPLIVIAVEYVTMIVAQIAPYQG